MPRTNRRKAKVDSNQKEIVEALRSIPGITVAPDHDDILVGYRNRTWWYELKSPGKERRLQPSQVKLFNEWTGHYRVVSSLKEILRDLGVVK